LKKNSFTYNFFEYILLCFCRCIFKNKKFIKKQDLLKNSNDLSDYYLDINIYIKNMIELDLIKHAIFSNNKNLKYLLDNFRPCLKNDYSERFNNRLSNLYANKLTENEMENYIGSIKEHSSNFDFINQIKSFYEM